LIHYKNQHKNYQKLPKFEKVFSKVNFTTNFNSFATNGKNRSIRKEQKGFLAHPKRAARFFRTQKNFFSNKNQQKQNKSSTKATENRREKSFWKPFGPFWMRWKPSVLSKKDGVLQMNWNLY
jgi:hypothetical protein